MSRLTELKKQIKNTPATGNLTRHEMLKLSLNMPQQQRTFQPSLINNQPTLAQRKQEQVDSKMKRLEQLSKVGTNGTKKAFSSEDARRKKGKR